MTCVQWCSGCYQERWQAFEQKVKDADYLAHLGITHALLRYTNIKSMPTRGWTGEESWVRGSQNCA